MHPVKFDNGLLYEAETSYNSPFFVPLPPLADLSKKQAHRAQLIGKQVVCENVPRTRALATCDWLTLTARGPPSP